ncbi:MAG: DUF2490 domain-containing protein [bacterium]
MSTFCFKLFIICVLGFTCLLGAQENPLLLEPIVAINYDANDSYKLNFSFGSRSYIVNDKNFTYQQRHLEINHFSTLKLNPFRSISIGLKYRNRDWFESSSNEFRLTQQFNSNNALRVGRIGHRIRNEQRFFNDKTVFRVRYRFAYDVPLNGTKLDVGEAFLVGYSESLQSFSKKDTPETGQRFALLIGWSITKNSKFQIGVEQRFGNIWNDVETSTFILSQYAIKL